MKKPSKPAKPRKPAAHKPTKAMVAALEAARKKKAVAVELQAQALRDSVALGLKIAAEESAVRNRDIALQIEHVPQYLSAQAEPIVESRWAKLWKDIWK